MQFKNLALMVAALPAAFAFPSYKIPIALSRVLSANSADTACTYPEGFEIQNFQTLTPTGGNGSTVDIHFGFFDESTNIQTTCQRNATSKNVAKPDLAARWACDNSLVEFIWQSPKLTLVEVACPGTTGSNRWEASGSAVPNLTCAAASCNSTGYVSQCASTAPSIQRNFTSLQPTPS